MESSIAGSWFASGFHGNFRSKARDDILQAYRHEAQPQPPPIFLQRLKEDPKKHLFTKHENEQAVPRTIRNINDGTITPSIAPKPRHTFNFLEWGPLQEELKRQRPPFSTYQYDFWKLGDYTTDKKIPQLLVPRLSMGKPLKRTPSTIYQHSYKRHPISLTDNLSRAGQVTPLKDLACVKQRQSPLKDNTCATQQSSVEDYTCPPQQESPVQDYNCATQQEPHVEDYSCAAQRDPSLKDYSCSTPQESPPKDLCATPQKSPVKDYVCATQREPPVKDYGCAPHTLPHRNKRIMSAPLSRITVSDCLIWPNLDVGKTRGLPPK
ncbi:ciliary microtubule inner protein 7 [Lissotriton helveticus]